MNLNKQQSDIINYRPDLRMDNVPSLSKVYGGDGDTSKVNITPKSVQKSMTLSNFEENMPSNIISDLDRLINTTMTHKANIKAQMATTRMGAKYVNAKDEKTRNQIVKENALAIDGTTYIESYIQLDNILDEMVQVRRVYSEGTYGEDVSAELAKEIDSADVDRLYTLEMENDYENINYTSLYYETFVSCIMQGYCYSMEDTVISDIGNMSEFSKETPQDDRLIQLMSHNFQKKEEILQKDIFKDRKTSYNVRVALRNTFLAIQEYEDSLDAINNSLTNMDDNVLALELQRDLLTDLSESMEDLLSITTFSVIAKQDISKSLLGKSNIREYFI